MLTLSLLLCRILQQPTTMNIKSLTSAFLFSLLTVSVFGQVPDLDISLVDNGNSEIEVVIRPVGAFDEVFSSLVFTIRWDAVSGASLGAVSQVIPEAIYMPVAKSGGEIDDNGNRYQVFAGFGVSQLSAFGAAFVGGQEIVLLTIPVINGMSSFEIVNDAWTGDPANNGDFFVSLNGIPTTGIIYGGAISTNVDENLASSDVRVVPNPSQGNVQLQLSNLIGETAVIELVNPLGQIILTEGLTISGPSVVKDIDLSDYQKGSYFFRIARNDRVEVVPFVLN